MTRKTSDPSHPPDEGRPGRLLTFVQLASFSRRWDRLGLGDEDLRALEREIAANPTRAPVLRGSDGLRKLRFAGADEGRGKRGAFRVGYAVFPEHGLVALVVVFGKNDQAELSAGDRALCARVLREIRTELDRSPPR